MRRLLLIVFIAVMPALLSAQTFEWVKGIKTSLNEMETDNAGNVYTVGGFSSTVDFDPGPGIVNRTASNATSGFLHKLNTAGNFRWVRTYGLSTQALKVDGNNIYMGGYYDYNANFGSGVTLTSNGYRGYVVKTDTLGNAQWAVSLGGATGGIISSLAVDKDGDIYAAGVYNGTWALLSKITGTGTVLWTKYFNYEANSNYFFVAVDDSKNIYLAGEFHDAGDFDPGTGVFTLTPNGGSDDVFLQKLDASGNFLWAKLIGGSRDDYPKSITIDSVGNIYTAGFFRGTVDFDPGPGVVSHTTGNGTNGFIVKWDASGNYVWVVALKDADPSQITFFSQVTSITIDDKGFLYATGDHNGTMDLNPGNGRAIVKSTPTGGDKFIQKLDLDGNFIYAATYGYNAGTGISLTTDPSGNLYTIGSYSTNSTFPTVDFDPSPATTNLTSSQGNHYFLKLRQRGVHGYVFKDYNSNCTYDDVDVGFSNRLLTLTPGNIMVQANESGFWALDSLQAGTYTITAATSSGWLNSCSASQTFTITNPDDHTKIPDLGLVPSNPCTRPEVSISSTFFRPCQATTLYVRACNLSTATGIITAPQIIVELDPALTIQSASRTYTALGNNSYRFQLSGQFTPETCSNFSITCMVNCLIPMGTTLCSNARFNQADACALETLPYSYPTWIAPCNSPYDGSSLTVDGVCLNDSVKFTITNTGTGGMSCYSPVKLFTDSFLVLMDSVKLLNGQSKVFTVAGNGRTHYLEVYQHPLHPGNSMPSATVEACGNLANWMPDFVNTFPQNDGDPSMDIFCRAVTSSFDPNDKTGYPTGVTTNHFIKQEQQLQYLVRFQNTGTDTAFTVVVRDTIDENLDIFSVVSGASSHTYSFRIYGPRVLEWTFYNILLPDSFVNEPGSHGFLSYRVNQLPNLPNGTVIENSAAIYFDFNAPVITNVTDHMVNEAFFESPSACIPVNSSSSLSACESYTWNGVVYTQSGTYFHSDTTLTGCDSTTTLHLTINSSVTSTLNQFACDSFTWDGTVYTQSGTYSHLDISSAGCDSTTILNLTISQAIPSVLNESACGSYTLNSQTYTTSGTYTQTVNNPNGCDTVITLNLTIVNPTSSVLNEIACNSLSLNGQVYSASGTYTQTLSNSAGCDSTITLNLSISNSTDTTLNEVACNSFSLNGQTYSASGTYTQTLSNSAGCDSTITLNLTIANPTSSILNEVACNSFSLNGQTYSSSGTYTQTLSNSTGCDSTITLNLTIANPTSSILNEVACNSFSLNGQTYSASGTYTQTLPNSAGCDSTITLNLNITEVETSVSQNGNILTSAASNASYLWVNCGNNNALDGEVSQTFTSAVNGDFAVIVTQNSCTDTSTCYTITGVGIENPLAHVIHLYPNPAQSTLIVTIDASLSGSEYLLKDLVGRTLQRGVLTNTITTLSIEEFAQGIYLFHLNTDSKRVFKIVKN